MQRYNLQRYRNFKTIIFNSLSSVQSLWVSAGLLKFGLLVAVPLEFLTSPLDCQILNLVLLSLIHKNAVVIEKEKHYMLVCDLYITMPY